MGACRLHPRFILIPCRRVWRALFVVFLITAGLLVLRPGTTSAHAELERSQPNQGAALGSSPAQIDLWFTEGLTPSGSSLKVYDAQRQEVDKGDDTVDPNDSTHLTVSLQQIPDGTYTVAWKSISSDDGHVIQGTFTFSVGVSRLPGAAATSNGHPSTEAVALRWLVFLGLMIPAGWFLLALLGIGLAMSRREVVVGGVILALLADLALVPVSAYWPGAGLPSQSLSDTLSIMPEAWLARLILESLVLALVLGVIVGRRWDRWVAGIGVVLTGTALYELAMTTHAAARTSERLPAVVSEIVHLESVAFWIGGLALLALLPRSVRSALSDPVRRFSRVAFILAPLAIGSGVLNAGITLPSLTSLVDSSYGKILLIKIAFVTGILALAWINRRTVHAGVRRTLWFVRTLRIELGFGAAAILLASVLSLWTPPQPAKIVPLRLSQSTGSNQVAHVVIDPLHEGSNRVEAWLTDQAGDPVSNISVAVAQFSMLEREIDLPDRSLRSENSGHFVDPNAPLTVKGWWNLKLIFGQGSGETVGASFSFMVPDPILSKVQHRSNDPAAETVFQSAIDQLMTLTSMKNEQTLSDGIGNNVDTTNEYEAPDKFAYQTSSRSSSIAIGATQWFKQGNQPWQRNQRKNVFHFPHTLTTYYDGATEFTMGRTEMLDGEECQIITFAVPEQPQQAPAWYAWWVGTQTHLLRREAMVAEHHYMINHNIDFNSPSIAIAPPESATP